MKKRNQRHLRPKWITSYRAIKLGFMGWRRRRAVLLPELSGITLSGEADSAPIALANRPADPELARRLALVFLEADGGD